MNRNVVRKLALMVTVAFIRGAAAAAGAGLISLAISEVYRLLPL